LVAELPEMVLLVTVNEALLLLKMPPPKALGAELPEMVLPATVSVP
jgi:hypothetical protein